MPSPPNHNRPVKPDFPTLKPFSTQWLPKIFSGPGVQELIEALREDATLEGDIEQIRLCNRALTGDRIAKSECFRIIRKKDLAKVRDV